MSPLGMNEEVIDRGRILRHTELYQIWICSSNS